MKEKSAHITVLAARLLTCISLICGVATSDWAQDFTATLRGAYEVPPTGSSALGTGNVVLNGNLLWYFVEADLGPPAGGIFGPAPAGANGPLILPFTNYGFVGQWEGPEGEVVYGGYFQLTDNQIEELKAGIWYIN